jgi:hypothetical protein
MKRLKLKVVSALVAVLGIAGLSKYWIYSGPGPLELSLFNSLYLEPNSQPESPLKVYHLGHSLVGTDMPSMLKQLAASGHSYESQFGWGTYLQQHWDDEVKGLEESNSHPNFRPAHEAIESGEYDALVLTDAVEIKHAIKYHDSYIYLNKWTSKARQSNPNIRVYFYETWHILSDPEGWLKRLDRDLSLYWEGEILRQALALEPEPKPIYIIPGGQVMAAFVRYVEQSEGIGPIKSRRDLFTDDIHFNDYGAYLMALTHYTVLYQKSPIGLPHALLKADGNPATDPGPEAALAMQKIVWDVVTNYDKTGVKADD